MSIYDFKMKDYEGNTVDLSKYKGKVLLVMNSATQCGFTPQYETLTKIREKFHDRGFEILDFPCNQFGEQAPGTDKEIAEFYQEQYKVKHPVFHKILVNGNDADALFKYLKGEKSFAGFDKSHELYKVLDEVNRGIDPNYEKSSEIKWNFTKFLIDRDGKVVERFEPTYNLDELGKKIEALL